ncbi:MAG: ketoacyl-ACP synthase III [Oscillospiraceae bacterium]|nr:ketoacyl-ACP synthase III [Oscillospiraceae bacterium]
MINKNGIKICGTGSYKPEFVVKNSDFAAFIDTDDAWITSRTGIKERRYEITHSNHFMAAEAAKRALKSANVNDIDESEFAKSVDMIIASTSTGDYFYPSLSCLVQNLTGAVNSCAVDVSAGCTGFVNALDIARNYIVSGTYRRILVVASERLSRQTDFTDRGTCILFGDGAGAVVVEPSENGDYAAFLGAIGENPAESKLCCEINYNDNSPFKNEKEPCKNTFIRMNGKEVYKFATDIMPRAVGEVCRRVGWKMSDIDMIVPHQANVRIINAAMKNLDVAADKVYVNIHEWGNISSACIPVCLDELRAAGRIREGMKVCLVAFGAGLTYGAIAMSF